jgi:hypothetical protein
MIKEKGLVVPLKDMFTHPPILLQNDITMSRKDIPRSRAARNVLIQWICFVNVLQIASVKKKG